MRTGFDPQLENRLWPVGTGESGTASIYLYPNWWAFSIEIHDYRNRWYVKIIRAHR